MGVFFSLLNILHTPSASFYDQGDWTALYNVLNTRSCWSFPNNDNTKSFNQRDLLWNLAKGYVG
jgi:hypothetical protein